MKNDVFSSWLKELISLIFVQTFQAFLLTVIMTVIVMAIPATSLTDSNGVDALGLFAIFALMSLNKIELLVKNIFGLTSQFGDSVSMAGGQRSFMGSMLALKGFGRTLNNGRKMIGGLGGAIAGQFRVRKAINARNDYFARNKDKDKEGNNNNATTGNGNGTSTTTRVGTGNAPGAITRLSQEIASLNKTLQAQNMDAKEKNGADKLDSLNAAIKEAKNQRNESLKQMASGLAETAGALGGATAGALVGMARGEGVASAAMTGAGVGDAIGEITVNVASSVPSAVGTAVSGIAAEGRGHITKANVYREIEKEINSQRKRDVKDINKALNAYGKNKANREPRDVSDT